MDAPAAITPTISPEPEIEVKDDDNFDEDLQDLFMSLISGQEDYNFIVECKPKNPAREPQEKIREVLKLMDQEIALQTVNLERLKRRNLKSIRGMTKEEVIRVLDKVTSERIQLLQFVEKEIPFTKPLPSLTKTQLKQCICCTVSESNTVILFRSPEGPLCRSCHHLLLPGGYMEPIPMELPTIDKPTLCTICDKNKILVTHQSILICQDCVKVFDDEKPRLCVTCGSRGIVWDGIKYNCRVCHPRSENMNCHRCHHSMTYADSRKLCPVCDRETLKSIGMQVPISSQGVVCAQGPQSCSVCGSTDLIPSANPTEYYCNGTCGRFTGRTVDTLFTLRGKHWTDFERLRKGFESNQSIVTTLGTSPVKIKSVLGNYMGEKVKNQFFQDILDIVGGCILCYKDKGATAYISPKALKESSLDKCREIYVRFVKYYSDKGILDRKWELIEFYSNVPTNQESATFSLEYSYMPERMSLYYKNSYVTTVAI